MDGVGGTSSHFSGTYKSRTGREAEGLQRSLGETEMPLLLVVVVGFKLLCLRDLACLCPGMLALSFALGLLNTRE